MKQFRQLFERPRDAHKGGFGRVLIVGGAPGMAGAVALSGLACLRSGAGLVRIAAPAPQVAAIAASSPCLMTAALPCTPRGLLSLAAKPVLESLLEWADVAAIGPGLGQSAAVAAIVARVFRHCSKPLVIDADGLNALASVGPLPPGGPRILTPHPGEFSRLAQAGGWSPGHSRQADAQRLSEQWRSVVVLKGRDSVIADGARCHVNSTGNPGMATAGSGDVLTGVVALWAQGLDAWDVARGAAHVHGLAGDLAATRLGEISLIASDVIDCLSSAFQLWSEQMPLDKSPGPERK